MHILTTAKCAILLKQKNLHPISIHHKFRSNLPNFASIGEGQNFTISEIYLHPSHTKRKVSSSKTTAHLSEEEYSTSKDVALLQVSFSRQRISYPATLKTVQIEAAINKRRLNKIKSRRNRVMAFTIQTKNINHTETNSISNIECDRDLDIVSPNVLKFTCDNKTEDSEQMNHPIRGVEGFPLLAFLSKPRNRQLISVIGCKTAQVLFFMCVSVILLYNYI